MSVCITITMDGQAGPVSNSAEWTMNAVVELCHKTVGPETVCVMYGEGQSHCQSTSQNEKLMAQAISVKASLTLS